MKNRKKTFDTGKGVSGHPASAPVNTEHSPYAFAKMVEKNMKSKGFPNARVEKIKDGYKVESGARDSRTSKKERR